jgi:hypothetical protein
MKTKIFLLPLILLLQISVYSQVWTDPVDISNADYNMDNQPDICIDNNGVLHCVFTHKENLYWRKIMYSKSTDDGTTWSDPVCISQNDELSMMDARIVSDSDNVLHVCYTYNSMDPQNTLIFYTTYVNEEWETPYNISPGMPNSDYNLIEIDYNDNIHFIWIYANYTLYHRVYNVVSGEWSEPYCPYPGQAYWGLHDLKIDSLNKMHCSGSYIGEDQGLDDLRVIYFYNNQGVWSDKTFVSPETILGSGTIGLGIDIDSTNLSHIVYRQQDPFTSVGYNNDSTMYTFSHGDVWSLPDLVVNDPVDQRIVIDQCDRVHIVDREKLGDGGKIVHYQWDNGWYGYQVDSSSVNIMNPMIYEKNNTLYLVYYNCNSMEDCRVRFTKNVLPVEISDDFFPVKEFTLSPNPSDGIVNIEFSTLKSEHLVCNIYDINGRLIYTFPDSEYIPGKHSLQWTGVDQENKKIPSGTYVIVIQSGKKLVSKPVIIN